jgi:hypothetical protein
MKLNILGGATYCEPQVLQLYKADLCEVKDVKRLLVTYLCLLQWMSSSIFFCLAYQGKDIVFSFIIECSSLRDFGP